MEHHRRVEQVRRLQHGQCQMGLLRSSGCHLRCMFHLRLMSPSDTQACVGEWMQFMRGEYAAVLGVGSMPDWQWQWVQHLEKGICINKCKNTCIYIFSIYLCYYMCEDMW